MMIGIVVFSMLVIGVVKRSRAAVPSAGSGGSAGGSSGSGQMVTVGANASSTNASTSGSQQTSAVKKTVQTNAAGQGQSQSSNQSQTKTQTKTQTKQTTKKKELQKSNPKAAVAARPRPQRVVGPRNAINAAARGRQTRVAVSSSRRGAIVGTRAARTVGQSLRYSLRMRQPVARFSSGGRAPAINAFAHSRFERGTKKAKEGKGNEGGAATKTQSGGASQAQSR